LTASRFSISFSVGEMVSTTHWCCRVVVGQARGFVGIWSRILKLLVDMMRATEGAYKIWQSLILSVQGHFAVLQGHLQQTSEIVFASGDVRVLSFGPFDLAVTF
jgi:hypothetical protein